MKHLRMGSLAVGFLAVLVVAGAAAPCRADSADAIVSPAAGEPPSIEGKPLRFWMDALHDNNLHVSTHAAELLGGVDPAAAEEVLPALTDALEDALPPVRDAIHAALKRLDPHGTSRLKMARAALGCADERERSYGIHLLADLGEVQPQPVVAGLVGAMHDRSSKVRAAAVLAFFEHGPLGAPAVSALIDALADEDEYVRRVAAAALGEIGPPAKGAVVPLALAMRDPSRHVRWLAAMSLEQFAEDAKPAAPILIGYLRGSDNDLRLSSACVLASLPSEAKAAVPTLMDFLRTGIDYHDRCEAAMYLGDIGPDAKEAVPALLLAATDPAGSVRSAAADALKKIDPETAAHVLDPH